MNKKIKKILIIFVIAVIIVSGVSYWTLIGRKSADRCQIGIKDHIISLYKNSATGETKVLSNLPGCQPDGYELVPGVVVD